MALGREARSKQRSAGSLATGTAGKPATARTGALQVPAEKSAGSCEHELGTAAKTQVAPRGRSGTQLHSSSPPATSPQAPPLGNRGNGKGRKPGTASRCDCASWFSGPQMAASSAPSSAGAATAGAAGCSRLHHAQPSGGASGVGPRAPPSGPASPGQSAGPPRHQEGEGRAERPGPRGRSFRLLKINGALGRGEQEGSFGKGLEVTETPAGTQLGFPARNSCLTHQASGQVGPQARARRSGRGFCSLGGR